MELKRVSFKVAKSIKDAGYPQGPLPFYDISGDLWEDGISDHFYFPCFAPTYMEVWLWLWREKRFPIDAECMEKLQKEVAPNMWENGILTERYDDPEEAIISAIDHIVENDLIK